jgi:hypothetical protein
MLPIKGYFGDNSLKLSLPLKSCNTSKARDISDLEKFNELAFLSLPSIFSILETKAFKPNNVFNKSILSLSEANLPNVIREES